MDQKTATENIIIIAGGPSVGDMPCHELVDYGYVIGVNESSVLLPCHEALSMDRLWMEARYEALQWKEIPTWFRRCAWKLDVSWPFLELFDGDIHAENMTDKPRKLCGKNSGMCALNLAYQRKPKNVFMFGFDMRTEGKRHYFYDQNELIEAKKKITGKPIKANQSGGKYAQWLPMFSNIARQFSVEGIKVYNVCPQSTIDVFEKIDWKRFVNLASV